MNIISRMATVAATAALVCTLSQEVSAACQDGKTSSCMRNGCVGVSECVGGRFLGCEVAEPCLRPPHPPPPPPKDTIEVDLAVPGQQVGILFDGTAGQPFNDRGIVVTANTTTAFATVPNVTAPAFGNSVIVFAQSRQPQRWPAIWTPQADTVQVPLQNNIRFNVTFWIMAGTFATQQTNVASAVLAVNNAYTTEKAGIRIAFVTVNDATANPAAAALMTGGDINAFKTGIGFNPGEINVYVISTAAGGASSGLNFNGEPVILLGQSALTFPQILEHELGHAFVLWHTDAANGFDWENVMWPTVSAHYLTEGQVFRMHFHPSSQLNGFNLRPGQPTFICTEPATNDCPANNRRLWADGLLPPN